jgi:hypothetical protein
MDPERAPGTESSAASPSSSSGSSAAIRDPGDGESVGTTMRLAGLAGLGIVLLGLLGFLLLGGESSTSEPASEPTPPPDDTAATQDAAPASPSRPRATLALGDTLHLTLVAEGDVLGVRVRRDDDLRRPYWIEAGQAAVFPFRSQITVEQELDSLRLVLEGYPYPVDVSTGRVVISRDSAEAFADTLRGRPASVPATRDTLRTPPSSTPPPSEE